MSESHERKEKQYLVAHNGSHALTGRATWSGPRGSWDWYRPCSSTRANSGANRGGSYPHRSPDTTSRTCSPSWPRLEHSVEALLFSVLSLWTCINPRQASGQSMMSQGITNHLKLPAFNSLQHRHLAWRCDFALTVYLVYRHGYGVMIKFFERVRIACMFFFSKA